MHGAVSVMYVGRVSSGMFVWFMYVFQVGCARVDDCVESFGNLRVGCLPGVVVLF